MGGKDEMDDWRTMDNGTVQGNHTKCNYTLILIDFVVAIQHPTEQIVTPDRFL